MLRHLGEIHCGLNGDVSLNDSLGEYPNLREMLRHLGEIHCGLNGDVSLNDSLGDYHLTYERHRGINILLCCEVNAFLAYVNKG